MIDVKTIETSCSPHVNMEIHVQRNVCCAAMRVFSPGVPGFHTFPGQANSYDLEMHNSVSLTTGLCAELGNQRII